MAAGMVLGFVLVVTLTSAGGGCTALINRNAFFPRVAPPVAEAALPEQTRRLVLATADGERLEAYLLTNPAAEKLVIYFHGNAGNIGQRLPELAQVRAAGASVLGVGYRGYGASTGRPGEAGIQEDGAAAYACALHELHYAPDHIILMGRSLGSTVALHVAAGKDVGGVVLITPLSSGADFARAHLGGAFAWAAGRSFDNLAKAALVRAPVLVVHGTDDEVIPFAQGRALYAALTAPKRLVPIAGGRHNDLERRDPETYWGAIRRFLAAPGEVADAMR